MLRREQIERLKERYPAGTVVRLGQMEGEHQMPILEMKAASKSLEDVFLELTSQEGGTK